MKKYLDLIFGSTLGRKYLMAISGAALFLFTIGHMAGNLQIFAGSDLINEYAAKLKSLPELLWTARLGLLCMVALHIAMAVKLSQANHDARPAPYDDGREPAFGSRQNSRVMLYSGLVLAAFILFHLAHFTLLWVKPDYAGWEDAHHRHDVYRMIVDAFSNKFIVLFYVGSMALLFYHLSHGISAMFQSLGLKTKRHEALIDGFARVFSVGLFAGFSAVPLAVAIGFIE